MKRTFGSMIVAAVALTAVVSLLPLPAQALLLFYDKNSNPPLPTNDFVDWETAFPGGGGCIRSEWFTSDLHKFWHFGHGD